MRNDFAKIVSYSEGNVPFILTVRDDGRINSLDGKFFLPFAKRRKRNDAGTRDLALMVGDRGFPSPFLLFQNVERQRMKNVIRYYFYERALEAVARCLARWGKCWLLDIHAFGEQKMGGRYDVIFGTAGRNTVFGNFDGLAAKFLALPLNGQRGLRVFVPDEKSREKEFYGAYLQSSLVSWMTKREPRANAIQMEIWGSWLCDEGVTRLMAERISFLVGEILKDEKVL